MGILDSIFGKPDYEKLEDQANRYAEQDDLKNAERVWRKLNKLYPDHAEPYKMIGAMVYQTEDYASALEWFQKASSIQPDAISSLNAGLSLKALGNTTEARQCFEDAIALDPDNLQARHNLAVITEELEDWSAALDAWQWMAGLLPGSQISAEFFSDIRRKVEALELQVETAKEQGRREPESSDKNREDESSGDGEPLYRFPDEDRCGVIYLFDYDRMGVNYGKRVFETIWSALRERRGRCIFADGDVMLTAGSGPGESPFIRGMNTFSEVVPTYTKGVLNLLGSETVDQFQAYAVAVYQEDYYTKPVHWALQDEFKGAYLGCLLLQHTIYSRADFEDKAAFWDLVISMETINGQILQNGHSI